MNKVEIEKASQRSLRGADKSRREGLSKGLARRSSNSRLVAQVSRDAYQGEGGHQG